MGSQVNPLLCGLLLFLFWRAQWVVATYYLHRKFCFAGVRSTPSS